MTATETLLGPDDPPPYTVLNEAGRSPFLLVCDHAGLVFPKKLGDLGLDATERARHIAWDLGIAKVGAVMTARLDACLVQQTYSRLVIDTNRPPDTPESIVTLSERTVIPGNRELSDEARRARQEEVFWPYQRRIGEEIERRTGRAGGLVLVSLHSFTPSYKDVARKWHAGILHGPNARIAGPMLEFLRRDASLHVGDNEPYAVSEATDYTVITHGERRGLPYVEIEVRQDLIATEEGQHAWAERLASALEYALDTLSAPH